MNSITLFMNPSIHIGEEIKQQLKMQERSVVWLAKQVNSDPSNLYKQLKYPHIHSEMLYRISVALNEDFFVLYSQKLSEKLQVKIT